METPPALMARSRIGLYVWQMIRTHRSGLRTALRLACVALAYASSLTAAQAQKRTPMPSDILVLGDSQMSFGGGPAFHAFFTNIRKHCSGLMLPSKKLAAIEKMATGVIGVRATGLQTWLSKSRKGKRMVCVKDPTGLVNARVIGAAKNGPRWVQIGESRAHDFCARGRSPLQEMLSQKRYQPKLLVLHFMGLSANHWLKKGNAERDMAQVVKLLPKDTGCIVMTTAPGYRKNINNPRIKAQPVIQRAVEATKGRCTFVKGLTRKTLAAFQGQRSHFYRNKNGRVRDPYHPVPSAARAFFKMRRAPLCRAVIKQLWPNEPSATLAGSEPRIQ